MGFWILGIFYGDNKKTESREDSIDTAAQRNI